MRSRRDLLDRYSIPFWPQQRVISLFGSVSHFPVRSELQPGPRMV
jgi:hypothetical protein